MSYMDDLKKSLEGNDKKDDILKMVDDHTKESVKTESEKAAKEASQKANKEAKNIRERFKSKWKDLEIDPDDDDFDEKFEEIKKAKTELEALKKKADDDDKGDNKEIKKLTDLVGKLQKSLEKSEEKIEASEKKVIKAKVDGRKKDIEKDIISMLTEKKAIKPKVLLPTLMQTIDVSEIENDEFNPQIKLGDGDDEKEYSITDGVGKFLEDNPEFISNNGSPGGNSGDKGGKGSPGEESEISERRKKLREMNKSKL
jgi:hypothetical protein